MTFYTHATNPTGIFTEKLFGQEFEFRNTENEWAARFGFTHELFNVAGTIPARVLKTVAYVCVDECEGKPVVEKWSIKKCREYTYNWRN